jgi:sugar phosphate isomerase/epimerase
MVKIGAKIDEVRVDGDLDRMRRDLECFARLGLQVVELPVHGLDVIRNGMLARDQLEDARRILRQFDFDYTIHSPNPLNLMERKDPEMHLQVFRGSLRFAAEIGARVLVYHAGRFIPEETFAVNGAHKLSAEEETHLLGVERDYLRLLADEYPQVVICVENARPYLHHSPYCYAEDLDALRKQVEAVNRPNVGINLDIGHWHMASRFYDLDLLTPVSNCRDLIAHTHIHDNFGGAVHHHEKMQTHQLPFGRGDSHMPVGWGAIPFAEILRTYFSGYEGALLMELRSRYFERTGESMANLRLLLTVLELS